MEIEKGKNIVGVRFRVDLRDYPSPSKGPTLGYHIAGGLPTGKK